MKCIKQSESTNDIKALTNTIAVFAVDSFGNADHTSIMTLSELLDIDLVLPGIDCASKDELISKLVERVFSTDRTPLLTQKEVLSKIHIREEIGGTLLPSGLSVPHARIDNYEGFVLAIGIPMKPIFHNEIQIRLMALMISSLSGAPYYLPTLAALTKNSRDGEYFSRLCGTENPEDFLSVLRERDQELD